MFKGWQLLCVLLITFPPYKNFETYLQAFIQKHTTQQEGRVDVMAKYCLRRLVSISKRGPRGKPPMIAEIETASGRFTLEYLYFSAHLLFSRMLHSIHQHLENPWTLSSDCKSETTLNRKYPSSFPSSETASWHLEA